MASSFLAHASPSAVVEYDGNFSNNSNSSTGVFPEPTIGPAVITPCLWILVQTIGNTYIVPWDIFLLVPNALFSLMLLVTCRKSVRTLRKSSSPIVTTFYVLVCLTSFFSTARCVVILFLGSFSDLHNQILWLFVRFFQLVTELSVVMLGLLYGHADSRTGIQRVLCITVFISVGYATAQGVLEKLYHKSYFDQDLYLHGGLEFTLISSACFSAVYFIITVLPMLPLQRYNFLLPKKVSFYVYTCMLCVLNIMGCVGSSLVEDCSDQRGFCLVSISLFVYFGLFPALIYLVFLQPFFRHDPKPSPPVTPSETTGLLNCDYNIKPQLNYSTSNISVSANTKRSSQTATADATNLVSRDGSINEEGFYSAMSVGGSLGMGDGMLTPPSIYSTCDSESTDQPADIRTISGHRVVPGR